MHTMKTISNGSLDIQAVVFLINPTKSADLTKKENNATLFQVDGVYKNISYFN